ncbi:MAG: acyl-CoA dehydrogenase [Acidimicrobiaceae bacterium]|nr:acyl-CoA dehydrogenase [Acidimicrobiaceae bacterium]
MDFSYTKAQTDFCDEVRTWLEEHIRGDFVKLRGKGLTGHDDVDPELQIAWERELATGGWLGIDFPKWIGGRECSLVEQVLFHKTYVEAKAPGRIPNMGVTLLGPTILAFGSAVQQERFIPKILSGDELWCQGYSEPDAGSDLSNIKTRAELVDGCWVIDGQKVWTSLAQYADWIFVVARTEEGSIRHAGLSYLLVPMDQVEITVRPIIQLTGGSEFNETFFDNAKTKEENVVGGEGNGWKVAMGTLAFERGASTLGQQTSFRQELDELINTALSTGAWENAVLRQRVVDLYIGLEVLRFNQLRMLTALVADGVPGAEQSIGKLFWASWHRKLGELWMEVRGTSGMVAAPDGHGGHEGIPLVLDKEQRTFLYSRAHTIYGGSNQIQRNIIGERVLGLPKEPR